MSARTLVTMAAGVAMVGLAGFSAAATATPPSGAKPAATIAVAPATASAVVVKDAKGASYTGVATAGEKIFKQCGQCHSAKQGDNRIGPYLYGVVGRPAGTALNYNYSSANKKSGITWNEQALFDYLENPRAKVPGTKMAFVGVKKPQDRADLIAYLKQVAAASPATKPK